MSRICPLEFALAHYPCALDQQRLITTPQDELALLSSADRGNTKLSAVYIMANDANGLLKIGYADHLARRLSGLNCSSPVPVRLLHFLYFVDLEVAKRVEREAHAALKNNRERGEWFAVPYESAANAIAQSIRRGKIRWWTEKERRSLRIAVAHSVATHEAKQRFFGA